MEKARDFFKKIRDTKGTFYAKMSTVKDIKCMDLIIFKSRDITLPTKVRLVKAMVFPVVMYGCGSWTMKKAEQQEN